MELAPRPLPRVLPLALCILCAVSRAVCQFVDPLSAAAASAVSAVQGIPGQVAASATQAAAGAALNATGQALNHATGAATKTVNATAHAVNQVNGAVTQGVNATAGSATQAVNSSVAQALSSPPSPLPPSSGASPALPAPPSPAAQARAGAAVFPDPACAPCAGVPADAVPGSGRCSVACVGRCCTGAWSALLLSRGVATGTCNNNCAAPGASNGALGALHRSPGATLAAAAFVAAAVLLPL